MRAWVVRADAPYAPVATRRPKASAFAGLALYAAIVLAVRAGLGAVVDRLAPDPARILAGEIPWGPALALKGVQATLILAITALMACLEGRSVSAYGLGGADRARRFALGWAAGLACLALVVALLAGAGLLVFGGPDLQRLGAILGFGIAWLAVFAAVGLGEEVLFRGYLLATLTRLTGFWPAAVILSVLFAATHAGNPGESAAGVLGVFMVGLMFCLLLRATGSLWLGVGFHTAWDWAQSFVFGVPDSGVMMQGHLLHARAIGAPLLSGGGAGPEASLLALPVWVGFLLALAWAWRRVADPASRGVD